MAKKKQAQGRTRANGEGSLRYIESKDLWEAGITQGRKENGKLNRVTAYGKTPAEAQTKLADKVKKPIGYSPKTSFKDLCDMWYKGLAAEVDAGRLEESTRVGYEYTKALIVAKWGAESVGSMTPKGIISGIYEIRKPDGAKYSFGYYKKIKTMLGQIFQYAVLEGVITQQENPMLSVPDLANSEREKSVKDAYSLDEIALVLKNAPDTLWGHAFIVSMLAGCRSQEMIPLTADDIAEDGSTITINKAVKIGEKGKTYLGETKTEAGERTITLPKTAWPHAKWLRDHAKCGVVFYSLETKSYVYPTWYRKKLKEVAKTCGVRELTPHCLRHTFATLGQVEAQIDSNILKAMTGHSDTKTLLGYTHVKSTATEKAAAKIDKVISGDKQTEKRVVLRLVK